MGDVAQSSSDFGYMTIRNFFETSHAKGPQDGAGANLKHKADMAVIKQQVYFACLILIHIVLDLCLFDVFASHSVVRNRATEIYKIRKKNGLVLIVNMF